MLLGLFAIVATALVFDYTNGFHDSANAVATSISTRALPPTVALVLAAVLNFAGALVSTQVAATLGQGIVHSTAVTQAVVEAALLGAIGWNLVTWWFGLPSSSSHALVGGMVGAVLARAGSVGVRWFDIFRKVIVPTLTSPLIGFFMGGALTVALYWICRRQAPAPANRRFRLLQTASASLMAFSHGSNDAQKTMGIIALALFSSGRIDHFYVPLWVKLGSAVAMAVGTFTGGKRIIRTLGMRLVKLDPIDGFAAETAASVVLLGTAQLGFPVSTTHVITTTIMGVGATKRLSAVKWGVTFDILTAWAFTLPAAAGLAFLIERALAALFH